MRLNKFIANSGYTSRRKAEELITEGRVKVNSEIITEVGFKIDENTNPKVEVNGEIIHVEGQKTYLIFNKPRDYTCTKRKFINEKNIYELLPQEYQSLHYIGRLDKDSSGLMILTNDGDFTQETSHPKFDCSKIYEVELKGNLEKEDIKRFCNGLILDGQKTKETTIKIIRDTPYTTTIEIELREGKKRQIRRMFDILNYKVLKLKRIQIGDIKLPNDLKEGQYRLLVIPSGTKL